VFVCLHCLAACLNICAVLSQCMADWVPQGRGYCNSKSVRLSARTSRYSVRPRVAWISSSCTCTSNRTYSHTHHVHQVQHRSSCPERQHVWVLAAVYAYKASYAKPKAMQKRVGMDQGGTRTLEWILLASHDIQTTPCPPPTHTLLGSAVWDGGERVFPHCYGTVFQCPLCPLIESSVNGDGSPSGRPWLVWPPTDAVSEVSTMYTRCLLLGSNQCAASGLLAHTTPSTRTAPLTALAAVLPTTLPFATNTYIRRLPAPAALFDCSIRHQARPGLLEPAGQ